MRIRSKLRFFGVLTCAVVLAAGLTLWLGGLWFWSDAHTHRLTLFVLVLPGLLLAWLFVRTRTLPLRVARHRFWPSMALRLRWALPNKGQRPRVLQTNSLPAKATLSRCWRLWPLKARSLT